MFLNRLYFRKDTGALIERNYMYDGGTGGFSRIPTVDEDYQSLSELGKYNQEAVQIIELQQGEYAQDFATCNGIRLNISTNTIEFSYPDPTAPQTPPVYQKPLTEQIAELEAKDAEIILTLVMNDLM